MTPVPPWLSLLAGLPPDAKPARHPVVSEAGAHLPEAGSAAGWYSLVLDLSLPGSGLRVVIATLDGNTLLSGSDMVYRQTAEANIMENVGGRFEPDGRFRGTHWRGVFPPGVEEGFQPNWFTPRAPTDEEGQTLRALLDELCRRSPTG